MKGLCLIRNLLTEVSLKTIRQIRKPKTGLLDSFFTDAYDLVNSFVIGDRMTDMELAKNLNAKGIYINDKSNLGGARNLSVR